MRKAQSRHDLHIVTERLEPPINCLGNGHLPAVKLADLILAIQVQAAGWDNPAHAHKGNAEGKARKPLLDHQAFARATVTRKQRNRAAWKPVLDNPRALRRHKAGKAANGHDIEALGQLVCCFADLCRHFRVERIRLRYRFRVKLPPLQQGMLLLDEILHERQGEQMVSPLVGEKIRVLQACICDRLRSVAMADVVLGKHALTLVVGQTLSHREPLGRLPDQLLNARQIPESVRAHIPGDIQ